ncbi:Protein phosphatase 2C 6 [Microbotryomycetes sp. JL221]|nr:Protein phosphatase 2C 6 [Microbotryomycetes sp. JL221]
MRVKVTCSHWFPSLASSQLNKSVYHAGSSSPSSCWPRLQRWSRHASDAQSFRSRHGTIKVNLSAKHTVGVAQSRGERPYQEDTYAVASVNIPQHALKRNVVQSKEGAGWNNETLEGYDGEMQDKISPERRRQVAMFGVFDGQVLLNNKTHGGGQVSKYLSHNLAQLLEQCKVEDIPIEIDKYRKQGGYLRRYRGGPLERFHAKSGELPDQKTLSLDEMCVLMFLQADNAVLADESTGKAGSVATVALVHSLDLPFSMPFYASQLISLTIAHLGDTRAILASTSSGRARALTESHHPDSRIESERLRQSGTGIVTDSFGEMRWGGTLANTRGIGDREFKTLGVIGEPVITKMVLKGEEWAFLVLVSDGICDAMSDQEIVDLCRGVKDPTKAAQKIVGFAEDVGGEDNMTAIVVPLPGWGKMGGIDSSASRREYRLNQNSGASSRQKRM